MKKLLECQKLSFNDHLSNYLPENVFRKVQLFFRTKRNQVTDKVFYDQLIKNWETKKLIWVYFLIISLDNFDSPLLKLPTIDILIDLKAKQRNKLIKSIETVDDQCESLNSLNSTLIVKLLNQTLSDKTNRLTNFKRPISTMDVLIEQYKCAQISNISELSNLVPDDEKINLNGLTKQDIEISNRLFVELIELRNIKISKTINRVLKSNEDKNLLFILGTAHFLGSNSILNILINDYGYAINKVKFNRLDYLLR